MSSSPSGKAVDCKSTIEGSIPSEDSVRERLLAIMALQIKTINELLQRKDLSVERVEFLHATKRKTKNLYNWIADGGDPTSTELKQWLR